MFIPEAKRLQKLAGIIIKEEVENTTLANNSIPPSGSLQPQEEPKPEEPQQQEPEIPTELTKEQAVALIKATKGKVFTVVFTKKDGTTRVMNARLGVKAYLRGGELPYDPTEKGLIPVFDMQKQDYRMVNINTIRELKVSGYTFKIK